MFNPVQVGTRTRYSYAKIKEVMDMPHLLDIQRNSYEWFMSEGLKEIFRDISPISDFNGKLVLSFEDFSLGEPKYPLEECKERDVTYSKPLKVVACLENKTTGIKFNSDVFMGDFPHHLHFLALCVIHDGHHSGGAVGNRNFRRADVDF